MRELPLERFDSVLSPAGSERMHRYLAAAQAAARRPHRLERQLDGTRRRGRRAARRAHALRARGGRGRTLGRRRRRRRLLHADQAPSQPAARHGGRCGAARRRRARRVRGRDRARRGGAREPSQAERRGDPPRPPDRGPDPRAQGDRRTRDLARSHRRRRARRAGALGVALPDALRERRRHLRILAAFVRVGRNPRRALRVHQPVDRPVLTEEPGARLRDRRRGPQLRGCLLG